MAVNAVYITSENLIRDLSFKQKLGLKPELTEEVALVIDQAVKRNNEHKSLANGVETNTSQQMIIGPFESNFALSSCCSDASEVQISLKLFLTDDNPTTASAAVRRIIEQFSLPQIASLILAVPLNSVAKISIGNTVEDKSDSEREISGIISLWKSLTQEFVVEKKIVSSMGLCDLEPEVFKELYLKSDIKPMTVQVNLKSCCTVPPELQVFAKEHGVKLTTHSDPPDVLGDSLVSKLPPIPNCDTELMATPRWLIKMQSFIKSRGVLVDKRYIIALNKKG